MMLLFVHGSLEVPESDAVAAAGEGFAGGEDSSLDPVDDSTAVIFGVGRALGSGEKFILIVKWHSLPR
jgi:hypothetical protein